MSCIVGWIFVTHRIRTTVSWDKEAYITSGKADTWWSRRYSILIAFEWLKYGGALRATYPERPHLAVQRPSI